MTYLGVFELGWENVALEVTEGKGGSFTCCPTGGMPAKITVGLDYEKFNHVIGCLLHEAFEFAITRHQGRYSPSLELAGDHSAYLFSFNHVTLSESSYAVAEFVCAVTEPIREAWEQSKVETANIKEGEK